VGDAIFHEQEGASEDSDCFNFGVWQVTAVKVTGCPIGLELLTPIKVGTRCHSRIEGPAPRFGLRNVAIHQDNV